LRNGVWLEPLRRPPGVLFLAGVLPGRLPRDDSDFVVFCFAKSQDAEAFARRFGGKLFRASRWGGPVAGVWPEANRGCPPYRRRYDDNSAQQVIWGLTRHRRLHSLV
jgi:hypothetical protein